MWTGLFRGINAFKMKQRNGLGYWNQAAGSLLKGHSNKTGTFVVKKKRLSSVIQ